MLIRNLFFNIFKNYHLLEVRVLKNVQIIKENTLIKTKITNLLSLKTYIFLLYDYYKKISKLVEPVDAKCGEECKRKRSSTKRKTKDVLGSCR